MSLEGVSSTIRDVSTSLDMTSTGSREVGDASDKIIVALDVASEKEGLHLVNQLREHVSRFKVGLQLFTAAGSDIVRTIAETGAKVFLDLKLHDIPNTVSGAVRAAAAFGVEMLTIHLSGGESMIRAAVEAAQGRVTVLGVTVLTTQTTETLATMGITEELEPHVIRLAQLGVECGVNGLVASAREAAVLRKRFRHVIKIVTPGIRPAWAATGDQKRVTTPVEAIQAGADYLVIGRPITADADPVAALQRVLAELQTQ
jgi:orotidine-5'-phosphate decarboxylase